MEEAPALGDDGRRFVLAIRKVASVRKDPSAIPACEQLPVIISRIGAKIAVMFRCGPKIFNDPFRTTRRPANGLVFKVVNSGAPPVDHIEQPIPRSCRRDLARPFAEPARRDPTFRAPDFLCLGIASRPVW